MKKIIFLLTFLVAAVGSSQVIDNTLTAAQINQNKQIVAEKAAMETKVNKQVSAIMKQNNVASKHKSTLEEIVMQKESDLDNLGRENVVATVKKERTAAINNAYTQQLQLFLNSLND